MKYLYILLAFLLPLVTLAQSTTYCTPTYSSGGTNDNITRVRLGTLDNSTSGNAAPYYRDYSAAQTGSSPTLQIPTLYAGTPASLTLNFGSDGNQYNGVWIDFNRNGVLETAEFFTSGTNAGANGTATVTLTIPATAAAVAGQTKMRIRGADDVQPNNTQACGASNSSYGEAEDYLVNIVATPCAGTPAALTATTTATAVCASTSFTLSATGLAPGTTEVSYQWQSSPAGANTFANLGTAQFTPTYSVSSQPAATDYRVLATCANGGSTTTSSIVSVAQSGYLNCYCTPVSSGTNEYVKRVTLPGSPGFTNASEANSANGYGDFTGNSALTATLQAGTTYSGSQGVSITVRSNNTNSQGGLWIDYNHSGTFDASEYTLLGTSNLTASDVTFTGVTLSVPTTALAGQTRARVRWRNGPFTSSNACVSGSTAWYGETEDYLVSISSPLPVQLVAFTAEAQGSGALLRWTTASEVHNDRFEIEASGDGHTFRQIGRVPGQGSSSQAQHYSFADGTYYASGQRYYRLRQVDTDGTAAYSPVRTVAVARPAGLALFPNPTYSAATLTGAAPGAAVVVLDAVGRIVASFVADASGTAALALPEPLAGGVYVVRTDAAALRLTVAQE